MGVSDRFTVRPDPTHADHSKFLLCMRFSALARDLRIWAMSVGCTQIQPQGETSMSQIRKFALGAISACVVAMAPMAASAANIQLGFVLDESGSINSGDWTVITGGLASAINLIPTGGSDNYYLSLVTFDDNANIRISNTLVTGGNKAGIVSFISGMAQGAGFTNYEAGFAAMDTALGNSNAYDFTYVNFATDGVPNRCGTTTVTSATLAQAEACAAAARNTLIASGVDNISIESIGAGANASFLQNSICYPNALGCDTTAPYNFPNQGFYIAVDTAQEYVTAIQNKVRVVTNQTPEPGTIALVGLALVGAGMARRRMVA